MHSTITRWFKKFHLGCKNLDGQAMSGRLKAMNSKAMLQAIEANSTWKVSDKLGMLQSSIVCHLHDLGKSIWSCQIVSHITKILQKSP